MSLQVKTFDDTVQPGTCCAKLEKICTKESQLVVAVGDGADDPYFGICIACAKKLFNALGFMICSSTGESIERLCGLRRRKGDQR